MDTSYKAKEIKAKVNKWHLIKLKSFSTTKERTDKTKGQPTNLLNGKKKTLQMIIAINIQNI